MMQTRMLFWTALALGSSLPTLTHAQPANPPPVSSGEIQLYSRPLQEEQTAPALPEPPRQRPDTDPPPLPKVRYHDLPSAPVTPPADQQPIPKLRFEDLPPEQVTPTPDPRPIPKPRYDNPPPPTTPPLPSDQDEEATGSDWPPPGELLPIQTYQGIRYVSGGIGEGERAELNAQSSRFNLRLLFAMQGSGSYVADVRVNVRDSRGELALIAESKGPWFLVELPPGTYTVEAEALDQIQRQKARISAASQTRLNFYWR
jgi:hypothetical protein